MAPRRGLTEDWRQDRREHSNDALIEQRAKFGRIGSADEQVGVTGDDEVVGDELSPLEEEVFGGDFFGEEESWPQDDLGQEHRAYDHLRKRGQ